MGGRSPESVELGPLPPQSAPSFVVSGAVCAVVLVAFLVNGRPIGAGDTRPTERVAVSLLQSHGFDLDQFPEIEAPFARQVGAHRLSIYPVLSGLLATPVFALCRTQFELDEVGSALAGKLAAALLSSLAVGVFFVALARRVPVDEAGSAALLLGLGTSVFSTSQALWQHPAAVLFLSLALLCVFRAEEDEAWAGRAGLPLALAVAARHADVALVVPLVLGIGWRWPRKLLRLSLWALPAVLFVLGYQWRYFGSPLEHGFSGSLGARFTEAWGVGQLGLLLSPAKGLFVFTPLALVALAGLVRVARREAWLALTLGGSVLAHIAFIGRWSEWHGGESFGPRMMTDALPLLFVFLPDGMDVLPRLGKLLAGVSIAVQVLGAFAYDSRWERLYQRPPAANHAELWDVAHSPLVFHATQGVFTLALPGIEARRAFVREYPVVLSTARGSRVVFNDGRIRLQGSEATLGSVCLQRGARIVEGRLRLRGRFDALFLRVREGAWPRRLELRVDGQGHGTLYIGERNFWSAKPRWKEYPMQGSFSVRHPYFFVESGGADLLVGLGKEAGDASLTAVALVSPREPENVIRLP
jgi:hypothetical protein